VSIFHDAKLLEPMIEYDGRMTIAVIGDSGIEYVPQNDWWNKDMFSPEEMKRLVDLGAQHRWPLPHRILNTEVPNLKEIYGNLVRYIARYIWIAEDWGYDLIAQWVISTYFRDQFKMLPLLIFDGVTTAGKSTALAVLREVVYRGELLSSSSGAAVAREITDYDVTMILDEALDSLQSDRGADLVNMLKSSVDRNGMWIRADPKGRSNYKYTTYTNIALSVKGDTLPEDVYNRGIRINMTVKPGGVELGDIECVDEDYLEEDCLDPSIKYCTDNQAPSNIRNQLYYLKLSTMHMQGRADRGDWPTYIDFRDEIARTKEHFTTKKGGTWAYALANCIEDAPAISGRARRMASTLYSIGLKVGGETATVEALIKQGEEIKEVYADTPESLAFVSLINRIEHDWETIYGKVAHPIMTNGLFCSITEGISTVDVAREYNLILMEQGNAGRDQVQTKAVTAKLAALGLNYRRGTGNKSYMDPTAKGFISNFMISLSRYLPHAAHKYAKIVNRN